MSGRETHQLGDIARDKSIDRGISRCLDGAVSWFCNFAIGIPHHNIMDKREELRIPEDLTVREEGHITEDTSSGCTRFFS